MNDLDRLRRYLDADQTARGASWSRDVVRELLAERDRLADQVQSVKALLDSPSDDRGITWWEWIDGGLGGALYGDLRKILGGVS